MGERKRSLIDANTKFKEDPERVREGMSGNICRCAAYAGITEALLDAQTRLSGKE